MPTTPLVQSQNSAIKQPLTLVIYASFGSDDLLSQYPNGQTQNVSEHPMVESCREVATLGVNVCLLIDRKDDDTHLVTIAAHGDVVVTPQLKCEMSSPRCLRGLLDVADRKFPNSTFVLTMEGHGAGYFPEIDRSKLTVASLTNLSGTAIEWRISPELIEPLRASDGQPALPMGEPMLPMGEPMLPASHAPISTWGVGAALRAYVAGRTSKRSNIAVIHFNNCFNMSTELLHTVASCAQYAASYPSYNFFTAGLSYAATIKRFLSSTTKDSATLARAFALENQKTLAAQPLPHPTVGCVVDLSRMPAIASALDALSGALIDALPNARAGILAAIKAAQQYDTSGDFRLDVPDALSDLGSLAERLRTAALSPQITLAATDLASVLKGVFVYGERAKPWVATQIEWPLDDPRLAMNIFLPDPTLEGLWDWRSPFYFATTPSQCIAQPQVIELLQQNRWVAFLRKLHAQTPFRGLKAPRVLDLPVARHYPRRGEKGA